MALAPRGLGHGGWGKYGKMKLSINVPQAGPIASDRIVTCVDMAENVSKMVTLGTTCGAVHCTMQIRTFHYMAFSYNIFVDFW